MPKKTKSSAALSAAASDGVRDKGTQRGKIGMASSLTASAGGTGADRASKLAQVLAARLSYASYKVSKGLIQQNINEIEHLHSSRFSQQAEQRKALKGKGKPGTTKDSRASTSHLEYSTSGPLAMLADPQGHAVISGPEATAHSPRNSYYGYTAAANLPPQPPYYDYTASDHRARDGLQFGGTTPPPQEQGIYPSPSIYKYIASPVVPSGPWSNAARPPSALGSSRLLASGRPGQPDFWKGGQDIQIMPESYQCISSGMAIPDRPDLGTPGVSSYAHQASLMPAASIPGGRQTMQMSPAVARTHARNASHHALRGEYSASNVTMDDLDSHFR